MTRLVPFLVLLFGTTTVLSAQTVYVQINLEEEIENPLRDGNDDISEEERGDEEQACSILEVAADGSLTEVISNDDILAVTGESSADCSDTGLAVAPDGTLYFAEDVTDDILRWTPTGGLSVFVDSDDIDTLVGTSNDSDNGMDVGPDGTLFVADEDCDCIYTVSPDGMTLEIIVTEEAIGTVVGNLSNDGRGAPTCTGEPVADLEGGLTVSSDGTVYFADDGSGCNPDRFEPPNNPRGGGGFDPVDSILRAVPDGLGGYTVSVVADEDDIFEDVMSAFPAGFGTCEFSFADLDVDIDLGPDGMLYVLDDGVSQRPVSECPRGGGEDSLIADDKVLQIDPVSGAVSLVAEAMSFGSLSGASSPTDQANFEGGIGAASGELFVGDRVSVGLQPLRGGPSTLSNIFRVTTSGSVSVFVSDEDLQAFYGPLYDGATARLSGGLDVVAEVNVLEIPVAGGAGLATLMALLSALGLWTVRRRM